MFLVAANRNSCVCYQNCANGKNYDPLAVYGSAQVPVLATLLLVSSFHLHQLLSMAFPIWFPHPLHSPAVLSVAFLWLNSLGLSLSWVVKAFQMGMSLGCWILILPIQHKIKSYFFYYVWVAWHSRVRQTWVGPKLILAFIWTNSNAHVWNCETTQEILELDHILKTSFIFPHFKALSGLLYAVLVEKSRFLSWRVWYIFKSLVIS